MRIINIIKDLKPIRQGVWQPAINTAPELLKQFGIQSEVWFPGEDYNYSFQSITPVYIKDRSLDCLKNLIQQRQLDDANDIIITHSPWDYQSGWGNYLAQKNFKWIFVPQGTLEPWSLSQKWLKKKIYFQAIEKKRLSRAHLIKASSTPEESNLQKLFPGIKTVLIPNGIELELPLEESSQKEKTTFLFMARLHHKKGVLPLIHAWVSSSLNNNPAYELIIAGPDDGELSAAVTLLTQTNNATYVGSIHNDDKKRRLRESSFYVLPSYSEGFPSSLVEAAAEGLIPVITEGCNFPELFNEKLATKITIRAEDIRQGIESCAALTKAETQAISERLKKFIQHNYTTEVIAQRQYALYKTLLSK